MNQFIKLSTHIINTKYITMILLEPSKFYIHMNIQSISGITLFGSGDIKTDHTIIEICEKKNPVDFHTIQTLIKSNKLNS
jgi:hypothetical protein